MVDDAGQNGLSVGEFSGGNVDGDGEEVSLLLIGLNSLVLSESFQIQGISDFLEELVTQGHDSSDGALVSQLSSSGGDGGQCLEDLAP